jgi:hypothetical protein
MAASIRQVLHDAGFRIEQSFDLRSALALIPNCTCPHHGTALCDCQYSVMLVYGPDSSVPITLVTHGRDEQCWLALADPPDGRAASGLEAEIVQALAVACLITLNEAGDATPSVSAAH